MASHFNLQNIVFTCIFSFILRRNLFTARILEHLHNNSTTDMFKLRIDFYCINVYS